MLHILHICDGVDVVTGAAVFCVRAKEAALSLFCD
jgi:hypothetical protein